MGDPGLRGGSPDILHDATTNLTAADAMRAPYTTDAPNSVKINILGEAQNWRCAYCGIRCVGGQNAHDAATRDHIVPKVSKKFGEFDGWENEVMACRLCNNHRGAMHSLKYYTKVKRLGRVEASRWAKRRHRRRHKAWNARRAASEAAALNCISTNADKHPNRQYADHDSPLFAGSAA